MVDVQEMILWSCLNWRIVRMEEIGVLYAESIPTLEHFTERLWEDCLERLLVRGLLVCGKGETEYEALYDLLSSMYIIPTDGHFWFRVLSFLKLTLSGHVPFSATKRLFLRDKRTESEREVMILARQALLSTGELIRCIEKGIHFLPGEESILDGIYDDPDITSDNIGCIMQTSSSSRTVILALANLYLRKQIIFERI